MSWYQYFSGDPFDAFAAWQNQPGPSLACFFLLACSYSGDPFLKRHEREREGPIRTC